MGTAAGMFTITVGGVELPPEVADSLASVLVEDSVEVPDIFMLRFNDPHKVCITQGGFEVGKDCEIKISAGRGGSPKMLMKGEITAIESEHSGGQTLSVVRGMDKGHRLYRGRSAQTFRGDVTASDVVKEIAKKAGLDLGKVDETEVKYPRLIQGNRSDYAFLSQLALENDRVLTVRDGQLHFTKRDMEKTPEFGDLDEASRADKKIVVGQDLKSMNMAVTSGEAVGEVEVRGFNIDDPLKPFIGTAKSETHSAKLKHNPGELAGKFGEKKLVISNVVIRDQATADAIAKAAAQKSGSAFADVSGVMEGNPEMRAGESVSLANAGDDFDGKVTLSTTRHTWDEHAGYTTEVGSRGSGQSGGVLGMAQGGSGGMTGNAGGGSGGAAGAGSIPGVAWGVVTENNDPEKKGRLRLKLPQLGDNVDTDWAPNMTWGAGKDRGIVWIPEVNDLVLVAFEQGDVRHPIVIGHSWNAKNPPKYEEPMFDGQAGKVKNRAFISRTGQRIVLWDDDGQKEGIRLVTNDDAYEIFIEKTKSRILIKSGGKIEIEASQDVSIKAGGKVTINGGGGVDITGPTVNIG